jgi:hypothetical protein
VGLWLLSIGVFLRCGVQTPFPDSVFAQFHPWYPLSSMGGMMRVENSGAGVHVLVKGAKFDIGWYSDCLVEDNGIGGFHAGDLDHVRVLYSSSRRAVLELRRVFLG